MNNSPEESLCKHCLNIINEGAKVCPRCGQYQNRFRNALGNHSILAVVLIPVVLVTISVVQLVQTSGDRQDTKEAYKQAQSALAMANTVKSAADSLFLSVEQLKVEQDSIYEEFRDLLIMFSRWTQVAQSSTIGFFSSPDFIDMRQKQYDRYMELLFPDPIERKKWIEETNKLRAPNFQ